eukprot:Seg2298.9 transcript_id=Seg2298.9/GoldUCD/mRNA.D3Y31 product="RIIa domain-containing protein 1" protein_id=Seg2298.9/GoldUCD/D3Y31
MKQKTGRTFAPTTHSGTCTVVLDTKGIMDKTGGLEKNDLGALTAEQQRKLNEFKIKTRIGNEKYIRNHPEVGCLLSCFISDVLTQRPENIREYSASYFTNPELPLKIKAQTQNKLSQVKHFQ